MEPSWRNHLADDINLFTISWLESTNWALVLYYHHFAMFPKGQLVFVLELVFLLGCLGDQTEGAEERSDHCYTQYVTVSVVKQVPSYSKHCTKESALVLTKYPKIYFCFVFLG